ncbi:hypothetical protein C8R46DRAFT_1229553 [Mycena filopes]|nr:hypothetical protein C8R46DRAFT_1229553 [Mycena filopes]
MAHTALQLESLLHLPPEIRSAALAAASGSLPAWDIVFGFCQRLHAVERDLTDVFLPVVFANLDSARIPDMRNVDSLGDSSPAANAARMGFNAVHALHVFMPAPVDVWQVFWPRVWTWTQFLETYQDFWISDVRLFTLGLFAALSPFFETKALTPVVHATPGAHAFVTRAWRSMALSPTEDEIIRLSHFLDHCRPAHPCAAELVDGCENDPNILAALAVRTLDATLTACRQSYPHSPPSTLVRRLEILNRIVLVMLKSGLNAPLSSAGLATLATVYTAATESLMSFQDGGLTAVGRPCAHGLFSLLSSRSGYRQIPRALKAGLLQSLQTYTENMPLRRHSALTGFLTRSLARSMVSYPVVLALSSVFPRFVPGLWTPRLTASAVKDSWAALVALAEERIEDLKYFQSPDAASYNPHPSLNDVLVVSNYTTALLHVRLLTGESTDTGRPADQEVNQIIEPFYVPHIVEAAVVKDTDLSSKEHSFLRLILQRTYEHNKASILGQRLEYMFDNDGDTNFYTKFDYTGATCAISVEPVTGALEGYSTAKVDAAASPHSRIALHQAIIHNGQTEVKIPYVLRSDSSVLADGLGRIWQSFDERDDVQKIEVELASLGEIPVLETHC